MGLRLGPRLRAVVDTARGRYYDGVVLQIRRATMAIARRPWFLGFALVLLLTLALAACGDDDGGGDGLDTDYPSAGEDRFENTKATVEIEVTLPGVAALPFVGRQTETVELEGPTLVLRGDPQDADNDGLVDIETEIVELTLTGTSSFGPIEVRQSPERRSMGMVEQQEPGQDTPADSFFDIFLEVEVMDIGLVGFHEEAIRMEAELIEFPPGFLDQYEGALALPTPLLSVDSKEEFALILDALHVPNPPPEDGETPEATPTPTPTPEATPTPTPTPTPAEEQPEPAISIGCDHRIPNQESDVIVKITNLQPGQIVTGTVTGPSVIGDGLFSASAGDDGTAEARVPISQFGIYNVNVDGVDGLSGSIDVGDVCTAP
jgi:hypothetical protein